MANRRSRIHEFYTQMPGLRTLAEKAAADARFAFHGPALVDAVVVRTDLNGYSAWARDRQAADRAALLDDFFTRVIPELNGAGGVYFRDEGDCIVSLFSNYFGTSWSYASAESFCMAATRNEYGTSKLSAKSVVACGRIAIYQKRHEIGSEDWSAEGDPFVRAGRLEAAVASKPQITYFADEYKAHFSTTNMRTVSGPAAWTVDYDKLQMPGLGAAGGWHDVVVLELAQVQQAARVPYSGMYR
jgi:hypothetical protein